MLGTGSRQDCPWHLRLYAFARFSATAKGSAMEVVGESRYPVPFSKKRLKSLDPPVASVMFDIAYE